jgi:hypothetical protein
MVFVIKISILFRFENRGFPAAKTDVSAGLIKATGMTSHAGCCIRILKISSQHSQASRL